MTSTESYIRKDFFSYRLSKVLLTLIEQKCQISMRRMHSVIARDAKVPCLTPGWLKLFLKKPIKSWASSYLSSCCNEKCIFSLFRFGLSFKCPAAKYERFLSMSIACVFIEKPQFREKYLCFSVLLLQTYSHNNCVYFFSLSPFLTEEGRYAWKWLFKKNQKQILHYHFLSQFLEDNLMIH